MATNKDSRFSSSSRRDGPPPPESGLIEKVVYINRCAKVVKGGRRFSFSALDVVGDGSLIAVPLPGHARGQMGLVCQIEDGRRLFLVADAAWIADNITRNVEPQRIVDRFAHDAKAYHDTLARLRSLHKARPEIIMMPSHCARSLEAWQRG